MAGKIGCIRRKTGRLVQAGRKGWQENRLFKKEDRQAGAGRQERLAGKLGCIRRKTGRLVQAGWGRQAGKIGCIRRKTGRLGQAGRKSWQER